MWGSWFGIVFGGVLVALLLVAIAFGTSALLFPVLIAIAIGLGIVAVVIMRGATNAREPAPDPRRSAAPASGEGSTPSHASSGTDPRP